jgi:hypothetical protein
MLDDNDDPIQHGIGGYHDDSDGITYMDGPYIGIVLSTHYADSNDNLWCQLLGTDENKGVRSPVLEAEVYLFYGGQPVSIRVPNCAIMQSKCSSYSQASGAAPDWSEDVPNGSDPTEVQNFFDPYMSTDISTLSGDWVVVNFLGGVLDLAYVERWFPNPSNKSDSAVREDGARFLMRRNGSELKVDKNGDVFISSRGGSYFSFDGETTTLKNSKGQIVHMDESGDISVSDGHGNLISMRDEGISYSNGYTYLNINGNDVDLYAPNGGINIMSDQLNMLANDISATGGAGGQPVAQGQLAVDFKNVFAAFSALLTLLKTALPPSAPLIETLGQVYDFNGIKERNGITDTTLTGSDDKCKQSYLSKVFKAD